MSRITARTARAVVAGGRDGDAVGCAARTPVLVELVVAELIEALDHPRGREALLHDRARAVRGGGELWVGAVDGLPVVHRVDEDLAVEEVARELAKAVRRHGEDDDVGVADDLVGRDGAGAGGEDVDGQRDVIGGPGARHGDVVPGRDRRAGDGRAELAGADDAEPQIGQLAARPSSASATDSSANPIA